MKKLRNNWISRAILPEPLISFLFALLLIGCDTFEFSPNQAHDNHSGVDLNAKNLEKLNQNPVDDTVTIAFVGDSQRWYNEQDQFVQKVNTMPEVDFVLLAGDISDFGLLEEFKWVTARLDKLEKPYFAVIGNHDMVANGEKVYRKMFGPTDFSFVYDSIKFVAHNTNSLETPHRQIPDLDWLSGQLKATGNAQYVVTVSHVPPFSTLEFNQQLVKPYTKLLAQTPELLLSLHGHVHKHLDYFPFDDGKRYLTSYSFNLNSFVLLKICKGKVFKTVIDY